MYHGHRVINGTQFMGQVKQFGECNNGSVRGALDDLSGFEIIIIRVYLASC